MRFAERALTLAYPEPEQAGMAASQVLNCRRRENAGDDLYSTLNRVQENLIRGGLSRRSSSGRLMGRRQITSTKADVRINSAQGDVAVELLAV